MSDQYDLTQAQTQEQLMCKILLQNLRCQVLEKNDIKKKKLANLSSGYGFTTGGLPGSVLERVSVSHAFCLVELRRRLAF